MGFLPLALVLVTLLSFSVALELLPETQLLGLWQLGQGKLELFIAQLSTLLQKPLTVLSLLRLLISLPLPSWVPALILPVALLSPPPHSSATKT